MNSLQTVFTVMTVVRRHATTETPSSGIHRLSVLAAPRLAGP